MIRDDFGGPGGWDEGLRLLGCDELVVGLEWDVAACATRAAAGHTTIRCDIAAQPVEPWVGRVDGYTGSPPCQLWSNAGSKAGHGAIDLIADAMADLLAGRDSRPAVRAAAAESIRASGNEKLAARADELAYQAALMLEPARAIGALRPRWVALEQVPSVLPLWERLAHGLRELGYSAWCGILNAADYGVPQTRRRAILMASLDREVGPPPPTHAERPEPSLFGDELQPWVSMAEALGWGFRARPSTTVVTGGGRRDSTGGNRGSRAAYEKAIPDPEQWQEQRVGFPRRDVLGSSADGYRERDWRSTAEPAQTVTEKARSWVRQDVEGSRADAQRISEDRPAPAVTGKSGAWEWQEDVPPSAEPACVECGCPEWMHDEGGFCAGPCGGACTNGGRREPSSELPLLQPGGGGYESANRRLYDPGEEPAPTVAFGHDSAEWQWRDRLAVEDAAEEAAAKERRQLAERIGWAADRPATTVMGDPRVWPPGHKINADDEARLGALEAARRYGDRAGSRAFRVTASEAAVLQGFDPAYPWQGTKTAQFQQIGNAIPPPLAAAILRELL